MNKINLIKNPELFQGEKYLKKDKYYFEGWYFKNASENGSIAFIPGININENGKSAFIQVITNTSSYNFNYPIESFEFNNEPFYIKIGDNIFSKEEVIINLINERENLRINGHLKYTNSKNINTNFLNPNIMGPFSYVPYMECNHAILTMDSKVFGSININEEEIIFNNGRGYIEKDWGYSFPKTYFWCQGNNFQNSDATFMCAIADIPYKFLNFRGLICVLIIDDKEYKFTTYNNAKVVEYDVNDKFLNITLKKGSYYINIKSTYDGNRSQRLSAPVKGNMKKDIFESICSSITVTFRENDDIIFSDTSTNCGLEIVKNDKI